MTRFSIPLKTLFGLSYYRYELTSSNYNPNIDSTITLTVKVTDIFGNPVNNKTVQLYLNGTSLGSSYQLTTNTNGVATATYTVTHFGIHDFSVANQHIQLEVGGWKTYYNNQTSTWGYKVEYNKTTARIEYWTSETQNHPTAWTEYGTAIFSDTWIRPKLPYTFSTSFIDFRVTDISTKLAHRSTTGSALASTVYVQGSWEHRGIP